MAQHPIGPKEAQLQAMRAAAGDRPAAGESRKAVDAKPDQPKKQKSKREARRANSR